MVVTDQSGVAVKEDFGCVAIDMCVRRESEASQVVLTTHRVESILSHNARKGNTVNGNRMQTEKSWEVEDVQDIRAVAEMTVVGALFQQIEPKLEVLLIGEGFIGESYGDMVKLFHQVDGRV